VTRVTASIIACGVVLAGTGMQGQTAAAPPAGAGAVIGTGTFTSFVENMDRSLAFYHDAFGMDVPALPASGERPYNAANPRLFDMFDIAGVKERHQSARVAGTAGRTKFPRPSHACASGGWRRWPAQLRSFSQNREW